MKNIKTKGICPRCGAFIGLSSKHMNRKRCEKHHGIMERKRLPL